MARTDKEIEDALALHKRIKAMGLQRAVDTMEPTEKAYARRTICHALEAFVAPQVSGSVDRMNDPYVVPASATHGPR